MASSSGKFRRLASSPLAVVLLAFALRLLAVVIWTDDLQTDTDAYLALARGIADGHGYVDSETGQPTAFRPPLYPLGVSTLFLADIPHWGLGIFQVFVGTATVLVTWLLARQFQLSTSRAFFAAALVAIDPILVRYTAHAMTETLFTFLLVLLLLAWTRESDSQSQPHTSWLTGLMLGLCALCRPTVWGLVLLAAAEWFYRRISRDRPVLNWRLMVAAALVLSPWVIRNWIQFDRPIVTTTHGGYTLLLGNNPVFQTEVVDAPIGSTWSDDSLETWQRSLEQQMASQHIEGEVARDAWMSKRAQQNIKSAPLGFAKSCVFKLLRFWGVVPSQVPLRQQIVVGVFYSVLLIAFAIRFIPAVIHYFQPSNGSRLIILSIVGPSLIHMLYWSNMRMRAPLMPLIAIVAVGAISGTPRENSSKPQALDV